MPIRETIKHEAMAKFKLGEHNKFRKHYGSVAVP